MKGLNKPLAVIIFGSPGSGKSTQAQLLAQKYNLEHFDTGKYLERAIYDPAQQKNPIIKKIRKEWMSGEMSEPSFVLDIIKKYVQKFASQGDSLVFSGSPRTLYEALGDRKHLGFVKLLEKEYGKKRVFYFELIVNENKAKERNKNRLVCSTCGTPLLGSALHLKTNVCPFCGGKVYARKLDDPKVIQKRFKVYHTETLPIFSQIKKMGYVIRKIPANDMPYKIFQNLSKKINRLV